MHMLPSEFNNIINERHFPLNGLVNQKLIDCLPGIFYLYEISELGAKIKAWNKNHEYVTGYSTDETYDKPPFFFISKGHHQVISGALDSIRDSGFVNKIYASIRSKDGRVTPHVFEGYKFQIDGISYFMGLGIDVSELVNAKNKAETLLVEKTNKEKKLLAITLQQEKNEKLLHTVLEELVAIREKGLNSENLDSLTSLTSEIKTHFTFQKTRQNFETLFNNIQLQFFSSLKVKHPELTKGELRYCAYLKIQMSPEQICDVLHISYNGLIKKRYRIRKKLGLERKQELDTYILSF